MRRAGTNVDPRAPALLIVTHGPFRFTRNPLYLSLTLLTIGLALCFNIIWALVTLVPTLIIMRQGVILREERYLEGKFGQPYLDYKRTVRRWI
jgi:protein-S-isoprenylcysteine O-methyltransferase Ste14